MILNQLVQEPSPFLSSIFTYTMLQGKFVRPCFWLRTTRWTQKTFQIQSNAALLVAHQILLRMDTFDLQIRAMGTRRFTAGTMLTWSLVIPFMKLSEKSTVQYARWGNIIFLILLLLCLILLLRRTLLYLSVLGLYLMRRWKIWWLNYLSLVRIFLNTDVYQKPSWTSIILWALTTRARDNYLRIIVILVMRGRSY